MNSVENKTKRAAYASTIMEKIGLGKTVVYIDETNCNLGRSVAQSEFQLQKAKTYM